MTRLLASTELHLTAAGVRAAVVAKKLRLASEARTQLGEAMQHAVSGRGYWLKSDTSG